VIGKLFTYALGRDHGFQDRQTIDAIHAEIAPNDYRLQDLIVELVASDACAQRN
jgi:hypothetical protein